MVREDWLMVLFVVAQVARLYTGVAHPVLGPVNLLLFVGYVVLRIVQEVEG
jgi:hypothetical protein